MEFKEIIFQNKKGIAVITLNRPDVRNAITGHEMLSEIESACNIVNDNRDIKVLIITGADPAFSSGGNIKDMAAKKGMFQGTPTQIMINYKRNVQRIPVAVNNVEVPTIAAVNGAAIGAGLDLALMCDMRVASTKAKFGETFLNVGLIPGDGGAYFLPRVVGMAKACELTFTGDIIDAATAREIGLVNYVVEHENLLEKANELASKIATKPSEALRMSKRLLYMAQSSTLPYLLEQSAAFQALCHHSDDHQEALSAIFEKREPNYSGK
ncbi:MAG: crotonase/enoyl-CoA hydratase family protein [Candidatus Magnetomorum sp.]|nr:crotonase/enoyl-CoA hydratase family protein [Candidatus Magnetomorum sp.]